MKIAIVTDAWHPQINGLVTAYTNLSRELTAQGCDVHIVSSEGFVALPCPTYPEIKLAVWPYPKLARSFDASHFEAIHIATEGPMGHAVRRYCLNRGLTFTTSMHTQFPEYIRMRLPIPIIWSYRYLRRFHAAAARTLVPTASLLESLKNRGFKNLEICRHGVDTTVFKPTPGPGLELPRPILMYMGRVAVEKNIEAFLELDLLGSYCVVGDGPDLPRLKSRYPHAHFFGYRFGHDLAGLLSAADVLVFPSLTDTFGLVMLEAMAFGTPVAAYPVTGPNDVVDNGVSG